MPGGVKWRPSFVWLLEEAVKKAISISFSRLVLQVPLLLGVKLLDPIAEFVLALISFASLASTFPHRHSAILTE